MIQRPFYRLMLVGLVLTLAGCGALNWEREPPYILVASWGSPGEAPGQFRDPTGIAVTGDEVFVADARNSRIQVFDKQGRFRRSFGEQVLGRPMNLAIADGHLYVPDFFRDVVHVFSLSGRLLDQLAPPDGFDSPGGVGVYPDGSVLVADSYGQRIVHLTSDGTLIRQWQGQGYRAGQFNYPTDVALSSKEGFYVADGYNDRVQHFGPEGVIVRKWGGPLALNIHGPFNGWFATVTSIAVGPEGEVFVVDFYNDRIQKFDAAGTFLTAFGREPRNGGHTELAVAVDRDGTVWSTNLSEHRVEQWQRP
ncbi:MAG: NHL repeat-containing protein [Marinobacter sp.]|uniref:NHL repeat-containing protein n=1 Tax=Marinobacter sp. TaxID=50741 RepID=UPI00299E2359|nr:NHL repeat-containing protein [Marinobacter sp.]MDX1755541.1 NHL repeat-containing protein [Marinobacter sp.]